MRRASLLVGLALAGACGFRETATASDGGAPDAAAAGCGAPTGTLASCTNTKARGYEPLGEASSKSTHAAMAPAGSQTAVVWEVGGTPGKLLFALVDNLGAVGNTKQLIAGAVNPALFRIAGQLTLFWKQGDTIYQQLLDDTGTLLNQPHTVFSGTADDFTVDWTGSDFGVLISGANGDPYQIYWLRLTGDYLVAGGPTKLAQSGVNSLQPALAWTGCEHVAAWTDTRPGTPAVFYARFGADFTRKSDDLMLSATGKRGSFPSLAPQSTGGVLVCYELLVMPPSNQEIACTRLDADGNVTATQQLTQTATPSQNPHVVAHGKNTWVLWDDYDMSSSVPNILWQFLDESGAPLLGQPRSDPDVGAGGWRAHGLATDDALYFVQYISDPLGTFTAEVVTENCF
jgi:hypothetical protein